MAKALTRTNSAAFLLAALTAGCFARSEQLSYSTVNEIRQGFKESVACIHTNRRPSEWCVLFESLVRREARTRASAFLLGANFGFSYTGEAVAEAMPASPAELKRVAECASVARVEYERLKRRLGLSDADVATAVGVSARAFSAWKARVRTPDRDESVVQRGLRL